VLIWPCPAAWSDSTSPNNKARRCSPNSRHHPPGGFIALDAGPAIPEARLRELAEQAGFAFRDRVKSFVIELRPKLVFAQER